MTIGTGSSVDVNMGSLPTGVDGYVLYMQGPGDVDFRLVYAGSDSTVEIGPPPPATVTATSVASDTPLLPGHYVYAVQGYSGIINDGFYTQYAYASVDITAGNNVQLTMSSFPTNVSGYLISYYDPNTGVYTPIGSTTSTTFVDAGQYDPEDPYVPPPAQTVPDFLIHPPTINGTGSSAVTTVPIYLALADYTQPNLDKYGRPIRWQEVDDENNHHLIGRLRLAMNGVDVTFFRGAETIIHGWTDNEPFGDASAVVEFPQISPFEKLGSGDLSWLTPWSSLRIELILNPGTTVVLDGVTYHYWMPVPLFFGMVPSFEDRQDEASASLTLTAVGTLYQLDYYVQPPGFNDDAVDIGTKIADAINARQHYGFRGATCQPFTFGIKSRAGGGWNQLLSGYIQDLLSQCQLIDGHIGTLTVRQPTTPLLKWKDRTTVNYSVVNGQPGVEVNLTRDHSMDVNVIYGEGTDSQGRRWRNTKYPNIHPDTAPLYPPPASFTFQPGGSKTGFTPFAERMRDDGYNMYSGDKYDARDQSEVRDAQERAGILVDGIVGPQTWAAVFHVGSNEGSLSGAYFAPLAMDPTTTPWLYNTRGGIIGKNPKWNPRAVRIEKYENFGDRITRQEGMSSAISERHRKNGYVGTITIKTDSSHGSRFMIRAGQNIMVNGYRGQNILLHIAQVDRDLMADVPTVTLTVDSEARDLMTIAAIIERDRETSNPANRQQVSKRASATVVDNLVVWDSEAGAGIIPKHAQYAGLWSVLKMPAGERGTIVRTYVHAGDVNSEFAIAVFSKPVTDVQLRSLLGNPLANTSDGKNPWDKYAAQLDAMGYMYAAGGPDSPGGYWPQVKSGTTNPLTGKMRDDASWYYESDVPPWIWVAIYTKNSCYVDGRLYPGISDQ